ncbi:MAG: hypothetical protein Q9182_006391 [Xanthomendoza sp. 2 TL-2023]
MDLARFSYKPISQFPTEEVDSKLDSSESSLPFSFRENVCRIHKRATTCLSAPLFVYHILAILTVSAWLSRADILRRLHRQYNEEKRKSGCTPAREALHYEARLFEMKRDPKNMGPYFGPPSRELDQAWHIMLQNHCLSSLFSTLTCHPDISLITMRWGHTQPIPLGNFSAAHECVDWDALDHWSAGRRVDVLRPGWLKHPVLGESFPDGRGVRTGVGHDG